MSHASPSSSTGRGRPANFLKDEAIDAAMLLFWRQGFIRTSLDDLVDATGASRGSLYKVFGDKRAIFVAALELYASRFDLRAQQTLDTTPDARSAMQELLTASARRLGGTEAPPGCLRCNSTLELYGQDDLIDRKLDEINSRFRSIIEKVVAKGVFEGSIAPDALPALSSFYTAIVAGLVTLARSGTTAPALLECVDVALLAWDRSRALTGESRAEPGWFTDP